MKQQEFQVGDILINCTTGNKLKHMENFKIKILNKEHLSEVLTILHKLGYYWSIVNTGVVNNYILTYNDGSIMETEGERLAKRILDLQAEIERKEFDHKRTIAENVKLVAENIELKEAIINLVFEQSKK